MVGIIEVEAIYHATVVEAVPFNRPRLVGREHEYIDEALLSGKLSGNGAFAERCAEMLEERLGAARVLLTPSCTAALEMAGILAGLAPGDEVIVPSFTFVSTANAFALRGAVPVFADIEPTTLNLDPAAAEAAITKRTRAIVAVHYGGVACEMEQILDLAHRHGLKVIEDAAHALPASWNDRPLGSFGDLTAFSFHETKNVHCGEGGALAINDPNLVERAEMIQEKGTDRARFFRGEVDRYTWQDIGSSYLMSELSAAFLWAQLEHLDEVTAERRGIWDAYHTSFDRLEEEGLARRPIVPDNCRHSGHLYYMLAKSGNDRNRLLRDLTEDGVNGIFHYLPLHDSPAGRRLGRASGSCPVTRDASERLLRLPLWGGMAKAQVERVVDAVQKGMSSDCCGSGEQATKRDQLRR